MDRTIDPAAAEQQGVGGIHHGVDVLLGDVALDQCDVHDGQPAAHDRAARIPVGLESFRIRRPA
jgi:hypothetical protein